MRVRHRAALVLAISAVAAPVGCALPHDPHGPGSVLFAEAVAAAQQRDFSRAFEKAQAAIDREATLAPAYRLLADAAFMMGRPESAVKAFSDLLTSDQTNVHARWALGLCYRRLARYAEARATLEQALDLAPRDLRVLHELLVVARAQGDLDSVFLALDERRRRPGAPVAALTFAMAEAREMAYRLREAEILLHESFGSERLPEAYLALARIHHERGREEECVGAASQGLDLARDDDVVIEVEGELLLARSECHAAASRPDPAETDREKASEVFRAWGTLSGEGDALRFAGLYVNGRGRPGEALQLVDRAIEIHEALGEDRSLAWDLCWRTYPYLGLHRDEGAFAPLARALALSRQAGDRGLEVRALSVSAIPHMGLNQYGEALRYLLAALDAAERYGVAHFEMANAGNIANVFLAIGDLRRAREYSERVLRVARERGTPRDVLHARSDLAWICLQAGDDRCGFDQFREVAEQLRGVNDGVFRDALDGLALGLRRMGRLKEAEKALHELLEAARAVRDSSADASARLQLGDLRLALGDPHGALAHFEAALDAFPLDKTDPPLLVNVHVGLGTAKAALGRRMEALAHYREAIDLVEALRSGVQLTSLRALYFADKRRIYAQTVDLLHELHRASPMAGHDREAFLVIEKARARSLLEAVVTPRSEGRELRRLRERTRDRIARLQARLFHETPDVEERTRLKHAIAREEKYLADLDLEALKLASEPIEGREPQPATWQTARASLPEDGLLVEYLLGPVHSYLLVVSSDGGLGMHRLPARAVIEDKVRRFRQQLAARPPPGSAEAAIAATRGSGVELFSMLLGGAASRLATARRLVIVPDGILFYLPFEALATEPTSRYLGEDLDVAYAPSASVLAAMRDGPVRPPARPVQTLVAFGDPKAARPGAPASSGDDLLVRGLEESGFRFAALPASRHEVETIARLFGSATSRVYLGDRFREETVLQALSRPTRYVHFATHAALDNDVPARSGIIVTREHGSAVEDGILQAREIADLRIEAELVTLSACQTGLGHLVDGEGVLGLARAFQEAGARSLVVSLWNVSDLSTSTFMAAFYSALRAGATKPAALRRARLAMLHSPNATLHHPYYWAPFVLLGAP